MVAEKIAAILKTREVQTIAENGYKPAAVLVPIQERRDGDFLVLTKRADHLPTHKGRLPFPAGASTHAMPTQWKPRCAKATKKSAFLPIASRYSGSWIR
jgi:hypothetical protein